MVDSEESAKCDSTAPTALGCLADNRDEVRKMEFQLDANATNQPCVYQPDPTEDTPENGVFVGQSSQSYLSNPNYTLGLDVNRPAGTAYYHKSRGAWKLTALYAVDAGTGAKHVPLITGTQVYAQVEVTEPLLLSPFVRCVRIR